MAWGAAQGWPAIDVPPYLMDAGQFMWIFNATLADDDRIYTMLLYMETLEEGSTNG
jgi:hypothetical protein